MGIYKHTDLKLILDEALDIAIEAGRDRTAYEKYSANQLAFLCRQIKLAYHTGYARGRHDEARDPQIVHMVKSLEKLDTDKGQSV